MSVLLNDQRCDCIIIWGHGLRYTNEILEIIRSVDGFDIVRIIKFHPKNIKTFVNKVYSYDYAPISHLKSKIKYLDSVKPEVLCVVINNLSPSVDILGEGDFRHKESLKLKQLKTSIRKKFNPYVDGEMSHEHVIHATDNEEQAFHILNAVGEKGLKHTDKTSLFSVPHFLDKPSAFNIKELNYEQLICSQIIGEGGNLRTECVNIHESVQYQALMGNTEVYDSYIKKYLGIGLKCDYTLKGLLSLSESFSYQAKGYESSYVVVKKNGINSYLIVDGLHRAAIHLYQGNQKIKVCIIE
jgi:hypothetical protein